MNTLKLSVFWLGGFLILIRGMKAFPYLYVKLSFVFSQYVGTALLGVLIVIFAEGVLRIWRNRKEARKQTI